MTSFSYLNDIGRSVIKFIQEQSPELESQLICEPSAHRHVVPETLETAKTRELENALAESQKLMNEETQKLNKVVATLNSVEEERNINLSKLAGILGVETGGGVTYLTICTRTFALTEELKQCRETQTTLTGALDPSAQVAIKELTDKIQLLGEENSDLRGAKDKILALFEETTPSSVLAPIPSETTASVVAPLPTETKHLTIPQIIEKIKELQATQKTYTECQLQIAADKKELQEIAKEIQGEAGTGEITLANLRELNKAEKEKRQELIKGIDKIANETAVLVPTTPVEAEPTTTITISPKIPKTKIEEITRGLESLKVERETVSNEISKLALVLGLPISSGKQSSVQLGDLVVELTAFLRQQEPKPGPAPELEGKVIVVPNIKTQIENLRNQVRECQDRISKQETEWKTLWALFPAPKPAEAIGVAGTVSIPEPPPQSLENLGKNIKKLQEEFEACGKALVEKRDKIQTLATALKMKVVEPIQTTDVNAALDLAVKNVHQLTIVRGKVARAMTAEPETQKVIDGTEETMNLLDTLLGKMASLFHLKADLPNLVTAIADFIIRKMLVFDLKSGGSLVFEAPEVKEKSDEVVPVLDAYKNLVVALIELIPIDMSKISSPSPPSPPVALSTFFTSLATKVEETQQKNQDGQKCISLLIRIWNKSIESIVKPLTQPVLESKEVKATQPVTESEKETGEAGTVCPRLDDKVTLEVIRHLSGHTKSTVESLGMVLQTLKEKFPADLKELTVENFKNQLKDWKPQKCETFDSLSKVLAYQTSILESVPGLAQCYKLKIHPRVWYQFYRLCVERKSCQIKASAFSDLSLDDKNQLEGKTKAKLSKTFSEKFRNSEWHVVRAFLENIQGWSKAKEEEKQEKFESLERKYGETVNSLTTVKIVCDLIRIGNELSLAEMRFRAMVKEKLSAKATEKRTLTTVLQGLRYLDNKDADLSNCAQQITLFSLFINVPKVRQEAFQTLCTQIHTFLNTHFKMLPKCGHIDESIMPVLLSNFPTIPLSVWSEKFAASHAPFLEFINVATESLKTKPDVLILKKVIEDKYKTLPIIYPFEVTT